MRDVFLLVVSMWAVLGAGNGYTAEVVDEAVTDGTAVVTGGSLGNPSLAPENPGIPRGHVREFGQPPEIPPGADLGGHQSFWFAWSPFYPNTVLWPH